LAPNKGVIPLAWFFHVITRRRVSFPLAEVSPSDGVSLLLQQTIFVVNATIYFGKN